MKASELAQELKDEVFLNGDWEVETQYGQRVMSVNGLCVNADGKQIIGIELLNDDDAGNGGV